MTRYINTVQMKYKEFGKVIKFDGQFKISFIADTQKTFRESSNENIRKTSVNLMIQHLKLQSVWSQFYTLIRVHDNSVACHKFNRYI